ncbi:MAG TPA: hypothetical protein VGH15_00650 [Caulobacteraceae bacterium]
MTQKNLYGTYNTGYTLSSSFSVLYAKSAAVVKGVNAGGYTAGGDAVSIGFVAELINHGSLTGGAGGRGMPVGGKAAGPPGYAGGSGADLTSGGTVANYAAIVGGAGGQGGSGYFGGAGGGGGYGVRVGGAGMVTNAGHITGGAAGFGGPGHFPGHGGTGGTGVVLVGTGSVGNTGTLTGGAGGVGESEKYSAGAGGAGGTALALDAVATAVNSGLVQGGTGGTGASSPGGYGATGGTGGTGVYLAVSGTLTNTGSVRAGDGGAGGATGKTKYYNYGTYYYRGANGGNGGVGCWLGDGGTVINTGSIAGGMGGAGGAGSNAGYDGNVGGYGDGVYLANGGVVTNGSTAATTAVITGQFGVAGGTKGKVTVTNFGTIGGYYGGVKLSGGGVITNGSRTSTIAFIYGVTLAGAGTITNFGSIGGFGVVTYGTVRVVNFGYIGGAGGSSVHIAGSGGRLVSEVGSRLGGAAIGGGGTLELAGGTETITGLGAVGTITGGMALDCETFGTYQLDAAVTATLTGANKVLRLVDAGKMTVAAGGSLAIGNGGLLEIKGSVVNAGSITLSGATSFTDIRALAPATFGGGGMITMAGPKDRIVGQTAATVLTNVDNTFSGVGFIGVNDLTFVNETKGVVDAVGAGSLQVSTKGETLTNGGLMEASGAGLLIIASTTVNNVGGTILAATGAKVELEHDLIEGGAIGSAGTGIVLINQAGGEFNGVGHTVILSGQVRVLNATNLIVQGAIANTGKLQLTAAASTADLIIGAAGVTLSGKGVVSLSASAGNQIYGQALADTLTNVDNTIEGSGQLGDGLMKLVNQAGGTILGNQSVALTINTVSNAITNGGLIENSGSGGTLIESAVVNTGTLLAATIGTLTVTGLVTGAGVGQINGGTLDIVPAFSENVTFTGTKGVLELGHSVSYKGKVSGLSTTGASSLDLSDITFTSGTTKATYSGTTTSGTLTVTDGTHTTHIALLGNYVGHVFSVSSDGHGGTTVIDPPAKTAAAPIVQAMAALGTGPAAAAPALTLAHPLEKLFSLAARR